MKADSRTLAPPAWLRRTAEGVVLALHVQPGARRTEVVGQHGERLKIALQAPPVDGRANEALVKYLAQRLGLRRADVRVVAGLSSRDKAVAIDVGSASDAEIATLLDASAER